VNIVPASAVAGVRATVSPIAAANDERSARIGRRVVASARLGANARRSLSSCSGICNTDRVF
jgi:hypothetical protein